MNMKTKPFSELLKRMTPERREKNNIVAKIMLFHIDILEIQQSSSLTEDINKKFKLLESILSLIKNREDIQLPILFSYADTLGINLKTNS